MKTLKVSQYKIFNIGTRKIFLGSSYQKKIDRDIHTQLKRKYQKGNKNRNYIIDSVITQLTINGKLPKKHSYTLIKLDIKKFFESINKHKLYKRLLRSNLLDEEAMKKIKQIVFSPKIKGLPQGVSFSSLLAEIYLEDFDFNIKTELSEILFYTRYVDDILIILNGDQTKDAECIINKIENLLKPLDLEINTTNKKKVCLIGNNTTFDFDYLGYKFFYNKITDDSLKDILKISVTTGKIEKYSQHIQDLFNKYYSSPQSKCDFYKLFYSLRNLLWTTSARDFKLDTDLIFGFAYNYKRINTEEPKIFLNKKLIHHIHCKKCFSNKEKKMLYSLLFKTEKKESQNFNYNKLSLVKILEIMQNLNLQPKSVQPTYTKKVWVGQIFKELYK